MIKLTQREYDMLTKTFQEGTIRIVGNGDMIIANRLLGFGWLSKGGTGSRIFSLTHDGHRALTNGEIGNPYPLRQHYKTRKPS